MPDRTGMTEADFRVRDEGTIVLLEPLNDWAREWIDDHLESPVWWGGSVAIDHRCFPPILDGILEDAVVDGPS